MASQPHTQHLSDLPELSDFRAGLRNAADAFRARLSGVCDSETNNLSSRTSACETPIKTMNMGVQHFTAQISGVPQTSQKASHHRTD